MVTSPKCTFLGLEIYIILILKYFMFLNFEKLLCSSGRGLNFSAPRTLHRIRALGMALRRNCPTHSMVLYGTAAHVLPPQPIFCTSTSKSHRADTFLGVCSSDQCDTHSFPFVALKRYILRLRDALRVVSHLHGSVAGKT